MHRKAYIDWARGVAVLLMIWAHTTDAWTRLNVRGTIAFRDANVVGGFAAPLFLWLAGLAVVLAATRSAQRTGSHGLAVDAICRRGFEIFILGFLFRLQGFIVTPGSHPVTLFRVDILNIMGPAIVGAGIVWGLARSTTARVIWYALIASAMAMLTPIVRASTLVDALPLWFQWYIRPAGEFTIFTVFPWAAFVFAGGAVGALIAAARDDRAERRLQVILAAVGAVLVATGFYTAGRPSLYAASSFWTSSPTWFAIRLGILTIGLTMIYACEAVYVALTRRSAARRVSDPLAQLGRNSLFIYWIHVELVYGYASWGWRHRLPLWGSAIAFVLFSVLMYRAIGWRDALVGRWRRRKAGDGLQAVPFGGTA
ncbi:MAG TPA: heparan-alpha-glucosaminide N-acetyltransferase domain-containing protein [Vicinamibacterales bacterium]